MSEKIVKLMHKKEQPKKNETVREKIKRVLTNIFWVWEKLWMMIRSSKNYSIIKRNWEYLMLDMYKEKILKNYTVMQAPVNWRLLENLERELLVYIKNTQWMYWMFSLNWNVENPVWWWFPWIQTHSYKPKSYENWNLVQWDKIENHIMLDVWDDWDVFFVAVNEYWKKWLISTRTWKRALNFDHNFNFSHANRHLTKWINESVVVSKRGWFDRVEIRNSIFCWYQKDSRWDLNCIVKIPTSYKAVQILHNWQTKQNSKKRSA